MTYPSNGHSTPEIQSESEIAWEAFRFMKLRQHYTPIFVTDADVQKAWDAFAAAYDAEDSNA